MNAFHKLAKVNNEVFMRQVEPNWDHDKEERRLKASAEEYIRTKKENDEEYSSSVESVRSLATAFDLTTTKPSITESKVSTNAEPTDTKTETSTNAKPDVVKPKAIKPEIDEVATNALWEILNLSVDSDNSTDYQSDTDDRSVEELSLIHI